MEWVLLLLAILVAPVIFGIILYNRIVALVQNRNNAFADIDVILKQRFDLIPNLVETVKGYAKHENSVFSRVTQMRAKITDAQNTSDRIVAEQGLSQAMVDVNAVAEAYPDLKADLHYQQLMNELGDIENKLSSVRRFFNNATTEYNTAIAQFPANLIANHFNFKEEVFFDVGEEERAKLDVAPTVSFAA